MNMTGNNSGKKHSRDKFLLIFAIFVALASLIGHLLQGNDAEETFVRQPAESSMVQGLKDSEDSESFDIQNFTTYADTSYNDSIFDLTQLNEIVGVRSFVEDFPDANDVQLVAAEKNGIPPLHSRTEIQPYINNHSLVYIAGSPFYVVDELEHSMPYLTPKAYQLLSTISVNFIDSLINKGIQPHKLVVTSVLRTADDIQNLQRGNGNSVTNSTHCYGTTVDITYNRFLPILPYTDNNIDYTRQDFQLKLVLSEVLADLRRQNKCYVKYERRQACFHLTVR